MTIDDDSSVYVGGLPYDATEDSVRRVFDLYGHIVAVKIINDHGVGGKCYGFVTFKNPRSAVDAITDMNGRTIKGRVVRVNEVKTRGGRSNFSRESFRRDRDRGRDPDRDYDRDKDQYWDRNRDRSRDRDQDRERGYEQGHEHDRTRDRFTDKDGDRDLGQDRDVESNGQEHDRKRDREWERDRELDGSQHGEMQKTNDHHKSGDKDKDQTSKRLNRHSRELSSESSDDDHDEVEKQLAISNQRLEELQKQISQMEELAKEKRQLVTKLQEKSQKLEDALTAAKKLSSHRHLQLNKLHSCFLHVKDYSERLKSSEQELQSLVDATMIEVDVGNDVSFGDGV